MKNTVFVAQEQLSMYVASISTTFENAVKSIKEYENVERNGRSMPFFIWEMNLDSNEHVVNYWIKRTGENEFQKGSN